eukprot:m.341347 g.341347  ORF g.341347 m.341347 type:complete len:531 (+) comp20046_c0_seq1:189-1781(+)
MSYGKHLFLLPFRDWMDVENVRPSHNSPSTYIGSEMDLAKDDAGEVKNFQYFQNKIESQYSSMHEVRGKRLRILDIPCDNEKSPSLVFCHGFAGQCEQFYSQIAFYWKRIHVVAFDLPGHGKSEVTAGTDAYTTASQVEDIIEILNMTCKGREIVLAAHSYGTSLATFVNQRLMEKNECEINIKGFVFFGSTLAGNPNLEAPGFVSWLPSWMLDGLRLLERYGGPNSMAVKRFVHENARPTVKGLLLKWSGDTASSVVQALLAGIRFASLEDYAKINKPVALIVGKGDLITPTHDTESIYNVLNRAHGPYLIEDAGHIVMAEKNELVNALVTAFLQKKCDIQELRLELPDVPLHNFNSKPKWALKNYAKWKATQPFGDIMHTKSQKGGICGCKVLRQDDLDHAPDTFAKNRPNIGLIIDISRETPPYVPSDLGTCTYSKYPTPSKLIPTVEEVEGFIAIVKKFWSNPDNTSRDVAVHCHYGFNRTGFLIVCYLVEAWGFGVHEAVKAFATSRPPGIKHKNFVAELIKRYA